MPLYPFQLDAVNFHRAHHYSMNCSEMGLGKTRMALETAKSVGMSPFVVGPSFLRGTWLSEAKECGVEITYVSYSMLHKIRPSDISHKFWIADEAHYLKNPTAQRTHAFYSLLKSLTPDYFIALTGTPIKNRVPDFWTLLAFCGLNPKRTSGKVLEGDLRHFRKFSRYFCQTEIQKVRGRSIEVFRGIKEEKVPEFKSFLVDKFIRFKVADVLKDLPELTRKFVELGLRPDPKLEEVFHAYINGSKTDITAKVTSAVLKASHTVEYIKLLCEENPGPLVVYSDHVEPATSIASSFTDSQLVTGKTPVEVRQQIVEKFQRGEIPILVATIGSLSVGVTLTASRHVIFNDLSWVPADNLQAEKRIHRIGQKGACFAHYIDSTFTDRYIRKTLFDKITTIEKVIQ